MKETIVLIHLDLGIGGAERLVVNIACAIKSLGYNVVLLTSHHDTNHCFEETISSGCLYFKLSKFLSSNARALYSRFIKRLHSSPWRLATSQHLRWRNCSLRHHSNDLSRLCSIDLKIRKQESWFDIPWRSFGSYTFPTLDGNSSNVLLSLPWQGTFIFYYTIKHIIWTYSCCVWIVGVFWSKCIDSSLTFKRKSQPAALIAFSSTPVSFFNH